MKNIEILNQKYEIVKDEKECFNIDEVRNLMTEYFEPYDYVFGDYAYEKLRLKGFYDSNNQNVTKINDIKYLNEYVANYCSYGAKTFLIKKQ